MKIFSAHNSYFSDYEVHRAQQLVDEDISSVSIILEPSSKNTAPSIIAAATHISRYDDNE